MVLLGVLGMVLLSLPWCAGKRASAPQVLGRGFARGPLRAGAARVPVPLRFPLVLGGYTPPRPEVLAQAVPLEARALVLEVGAVKIGLVTLDILLLPEALAEEVRTAARGAGLGLSDVFVAATHVHTSVGGYDPRLFAELGGTSRYRADIHDALLASMVRALGEATRSAAAVELRQANAEVDLTLSRRGLPGKDLRMDRFSLEGPQGTVAELAVFAAHPTLVVHRPTVLDTDFVGRLAHKESDAGHGVLLFLQGAEGNLAPRPSSRAEPLAETFAEDVSRALGKLEPTVRAPSLGFARVRSSLPSPDASRLVPRVFRGLGNTLLCAVEPSAASVSVLELGGVRMVLVPGEVTFETLQILKTAARAERAVGLVDGYLGYFEPAARVRAAEGESHMQYFGPSLVDVLAGDAAAAGAALDEAAAAAP